MVNKIRNTLEKELGSFLRYLDKTYDLRGISPLLFKSIGDFVRSSGKRLRPTLFVIGYMSFAEKPAPFLYRGALALELLHDFMLVHDDIIDKSGLRRGKPSMHITLNRYLESYPAVKFNGQDLAIVVGDIMYAMGLKAFLSIKENPLHKEAALKKIMDAAIYTGNGEFIELLSALKPLDSLNKEDIYRIYDFKTAYYTFAAPLAAGASLAGIKEKTVEKLFRYGIFLGRAFQIKDDILGMFGNEQEIGKSTLTDLQEAKKTILIWYAYTHSSAGDRKTIKEIFRKKNITLTDLARIRKIVASSGALDHAKTEVGSLIQKALGLIEPLPIKPVYKNLILGYSKDILVL
ncbi:MAG: polyprenyl synthetase family protein [Candidatus Omnitrophica bacterium]|nr:polyprenyl synthetase family protein [Candidatus Omnitrophota bacterium]